jgi:methionyl-tRNA formyltransferase
MRIAFIGTTRFGLRCLKVLTGLRNCEVVGAVAAPPTFQISYRPEEVNNVLHADVPAFCAEQELACLIASEGMRTEGLLEDVTRWRPDAFVVAGWYHMIPNAWRALAPAYGLHASLLPDYSGGAPLVWAMINGERKTGITLFRLEDGVDDGPIVGQAETDILPEDDIATLYERIEQLGAELVERCVPRLAEGSAELVSQDERRRRIFPQRGPEDGLIDWTQPADRIHDFVRAQTRPYPGAFTWLGTRKLTVWTSRPGEEAFGMLAAGELATVGGRLLAGTGFDRPLELTALALDGKDVAPASLGSGGRLSKLPS